MMCYSILPGMGKLHYCAVPDDPDRSVGQLVSRRCSWRIGRRRKKEEKKEVKVRYSSSYGYRKHFFSSRAPVRSDE